MRNVVLRSEALILMGDLLVIMKKHLILDLIRVRGHSRQLSHRVVMIRVGTNLVELRVLSELLAYYGVRSFHLECLLNQLAYKSLLLRILTRLFGQWMACVPID